MKANPDQCLFFSIHNMNTKISASTFDIKNTHSQKLFGVTADCKHCTTNEVFH